MRWSLNLYNFMDGNDGLAALMTVIGFASYGVVSLHAAIARRLPWALAAATLPVLVVNWPPARIFLGDVGAVPLGFLAAALGIGGMIDGAWPVWFPVLVFLPFVADATVTLARRALIAASGSGKGTRRTTISGCINWARDTAEPSPSTAR